MDYDHNEIPGRMQRMDAATLCIPTMKPGERLVLDAPSINTRCCIIADAVVPEYRLSGKERSCTGHWAKRWDAAYYGAEMALKGDG